MAFENREEAAQLLAQELKKYKQTNAVVLALPRGGVPLGYIIAKELDLPLDVILIKKIGYPTHPEYAIGAVSLESRVLNPDVKVPQEYFDEQTEEIRYQLRERYKRFRGSRSPVIIKDKTVILVDDGIATGYTMMAAAQLVRDSHPAKVVIAVPVASPRVLDKLAVCSEDIVCLSAPESFQAVGQFYHDFSEVTDEEVIQMLQDPTIQSR
ncbi:phosphoribosyltransferase [Botryobacter ruber]|uniref:phosphoribosyltransferase n=1 Tax=Botryobacter ruber TaxID=2171629 RepID=UPI000E0C1E28|nr:phosphoribosyltransferase family protein [Botryobacter ruber]